MKSVMRIRRRCGNLISVTRIRPAAGGFARFLLLGWALTPLLYSQSVSVASPPLAPAGQPGFESPTRQNAFCGSRVFNLSYSLFPAAQAPVVCDGAWPLLPPPHVWGDSAEGNLFATTMGGFLGNAPVPGEEGWGAGALRLTEIRGIGQSTSSQSQSTAQSGQSSAKSTQSSATKGSPGHIFWIEPAFKVDYLKNVKPLTPKQKFTEWARAAYDPLGLTASVAEAAIEYSPRDGFCGYGNGFGGYAKCFGSAQLDANISGFFGDFVFAVVMHQDPRYFAMGQGPFGRRLLYAVSRVFITRTDSGGTAINYSALSGTVLAAAASNLYYPSQDRGFGHSMSRVAWDLGYTALFNAAAEFWPNIHRALHRTF